MIATRKYRAVGRSRRSQAVRDSPGRVRLAPASYTTNPNERKSITNGVDNKFIRYSKGVCIHIISCDKIGNRETMLKKNTNMIIIGAIRWNVI